MFLTPADLTPSDLRTPSVSHRPRSGSSPKGLLTPFVRPVSPRITSKYTPSRLGRARSAAQSVAMALLVTLSASIPVSAAPIVADQTMSSAADGAKAAGAPDPSAEALARLRRASRTPVEVRVQQGFAVEVMATVPVADPGADPIDNAIAFLEQYQGLYGLSDPSKELYPVRLVRSEHGDRVFLRRRFGDLPSFNGSLGVHMNERQVIATYGLLQPASGGFEGVRIDGPKAELTALQGDFGSSLTVSGQSRLGVYYALDDNAERYSVLSWQVPVIGKDAHTGGFGAWTVYVDAVANRIVVALPQHETYIDKDFDIESRNNGGVQSCFSVGGTDDWFDENGVLPDYSSAADNPPDGITANSMSHQLYDYLHSRFNYHSFDNDDSQFEVVVHVGSGTDFQNAMAIGYCDLLQFGSGWMTDDIYAHELSHLVDYHAANLEYQYLSGALDESFADVFGAMIDPFQEWLMGEDIPMGFGQVGRSMSSPPTFGDPDHVSPSLSGDNIGLRTNPNGPDDGFVHTNSGIPNKVAYLLTDGDSHKGYQITGMGKYKLHQLYFTVLTELVHENTDFEGVRGMMIGQATQWANASKFGFNANDVCQIRNAWASVGVLPQYADVDCDGVVDNNDPDLDNDGIPDSFDNCLGLPNTLQTDSDGDGIGDPCDSDVDGDGIPNVSDNCYNKANPLQFDTDGDGIGDVCDDSDGDGILDTIDNCPSIPNEDQKDTDGDGLGNACDDDDDNDGLPDDEDNCPEVAGLDQTDTDGDGVGDLCDNCVNTPNPNQQDCDGDGIGTKCDTPVDALLCMDFDKWVAINEWIHPLDPVTLPQVVWQEDWSVDTQLEVTVDLGEVAAEVHIIDHLGSVVAKAETGERGGIMTLRFTPDLSYHWMQNGREGRLPWQTQYAVELSTEAGDKAVEAEITVEVVSH